MKNNYNKIFEVKNNEDCHRVAQDIHTFFCKECDKERKKFDYEITISKVYNLRSRLQNNYFHGAIIKDGYKAIRDSGEEFLMHGKQADVDEDFAKTYLKQYFRVKHTSKLSTVEFEDFNSKCRNFLSAEYSCFIMTPDEYKESIYKPSKK